jgi:hypothetical protein
MIFGGHPKHPMISTNSRKLMADFSHHHPSSSIINIKMIIKMIINNHKCMGDINIYQHEAH